MDKQRRQWAVQSPGDRCAGSAKLTSHAQATAEGPLKKKKKKEKVTTNFSEDKLG